MRKFRIIFLILIATLFLSACGEVVGEKSDDLEGEVNREEESEVNKEEEYEETKEKEFLARDFFFVEADTLKSFGGEGSEYAKFSNYVEYIKDNIVQIRNSNPGTDSLFVYEIEKDKINRVYLVYTEGETYYLQDHTKKEDTNEIIIKSPIEKGNEWSIPDGRTRSITDINKKVEVPFGTFEALEITTEGENSITVEHYAKNIGLIKTTFYSTEEDADFQVVSYLEDIQEGAYRTENFKVYYPDFEEDTLVYIQRSADVKTNDYITDIFEKEFRNVRENNNLTPLIGDRVSIWDISYDKEKNAAYIDFSPELIDEMNVGAALESMILTSIVNSIGDYFVTEKVMITINGEPYQSGHIYMEEGEYMTVNKENVKRF